MQNRGMGMGSQNHIKQNNKKVIATLLLQEGILTKKEISEKVNLSVVSIAKNMDDLLESGVVLADEHDEDTAYGRKPMKYRMNPAFRHLICMDMGKDSVDICIGNFDYQTICSRSYTIQDSLDGEIIIQDLMKLLKKMMKECGIVPSLIGCLVIANPGIIYDDSGRILKPAYMAKRWAHLPLAEQFEKEFQCRVVVMNDIDLSALGYKALEKKGISQESYIYLRVDAGIGMGIVLNGELMKSEGLSSGEIGYVTLLKEDGSFALVDYEDVVSLSALKRKISKDGDIEDDISRLELSTIVQMADSHPLIQQELEKIASHIAVIVLNGMLLTGIQKIIVDGELLISKSKLFNKFKEIIEEKSLQNHKPLILAAKKYSAIYGGFYVGRNLVIQNDL